MFNHWNLLRRTLEHCKRLKTGGIRFKYSAPYMNIIRNLPPVQCCKLSNGLAIATQDRGGCNTCIGLYVNAGSRYEHPHENGITHFFEHVAFKATKTRTKKILEDVILATGAKFQCFTTREMTAYFVECLSFDVPLIMNVLFDCILNNKLAYADIQAQKQIVCMEMIEHDKNYTNVLFDYLHTTAFQGTSLEQTVMGSLNNVSTFNTQMLCKLIYQRFSPGNMVLTAIGGINHEQILDLADKYLCKLSAVDQEEIKQFRYTGSEIRYRDDSQPMAHVAVAFEGPSYCHEDYNIMKLATEVVGGWDKSQIGGLGHGTNVARGASHQNVDSYKSFYIAFKDTALWGAHYVGLRLGLDDMMYLLQNEFMNLCNMITDEQIERAKNQLKTKWLSNSESAVKTSHRVGRSLLYRDCVLSVFDGIGAIDGINTPDVQRVCYKYLYDKCPVLAAIGPTETLTDYCRIRAETYWLRL